MRILVDECLPARIKHSFTKHGYECRTVQEIGYGSKRNGELLSLAEGKWEVLLTNDKNLKHQQNMTGRRISILVFRARSNRLADLLPLVPQSLEVLDTIQEGQIVEIG